MLWDLSNEVSAVRPVKVAIKRLDIPGIDALPLPSYSTRGAAGFDLRASLFQEIADGATGIVGVGFAVAIPAGFELQVRSRSGLAARGIIVANSPGTIDSDYRGEIKVIVHNRSGSHLRISRGDRIAQAVLAVAPRIHWIELDELDDTLRGSSGFGSTGL